MWKFIGEKLNERPEQYIFDSDTEITYKELHNICVEHGEILKEKIPAGSKCAILCGSGINSIIALLSCFYSGLVTVPMSLNYGEEHCRKIIETVSPDILITDTADISLLETKYILTLKQFFNTDGIKNNNEALLQDVAAIMCTSGTTGKPKGAMITGNALKENVKKISGYFRITENDTIIIARPIYHCAVLTGEVLTSIYNGCNIYFFDDKYNPIKIAHCLKERRISVMCGTPTLLNYISDHLIKRKILHSVRKIALSGECLTKEFALNIRKAFPDAEIYNVYGLTEAAPRVTYLPPKDFDRKCESVGIPLDGIIIKIVDSVTRAELPANTHGVIAVKSPCVMKGYYNNSEYTSKVLQDGWLYTGDIGYSDEEGYLYVMSRADDMIIKGGMNIYPKEIENSILKLDEIRECMAYRVTKTNKQQDIGVDIVLQKNISLSKKDLLSRLSKVLPQYQIPAAVNITDKIARNASGKVIRPQNIVIT